MRAPPGRGNAPMFGSSYRFGFARLYRIPRVWNICVRVAVGLSKVFAVPLLLRVCTRSEHFENKGHCFTKGQLLFE